MAKSEEEFRIHFNFNVRSNEQLVDHTSGQYLSMIELPQPDDFHHHLRDGAQMKSIVPLVADAFGRAIVMPNLVPPIRTTNEAAHYRQRILDAVPPGRTFEPLMTLYLTDSTTAEEIVKAKQSGIVIGAKLYPAGATTNSESGVTSIGNIQAVLQTMEDIGLPLLVHGEVTDAEVDVFDREKVFIDTILRPLTERHPHLRIVLEHITTQDAVDFIQSRTNPDGSPNMNVAATVTAHHLLYNRTDLFRGGIHPHLFCLPILKREPHRTALLQAATSGDPRFFLGTDSAPHSIAAKETSCGCAGIVTAHAALELYAEAFDSVGKITALAGFASVHGQRFYGLPVSERKVRLVWKEWTVPEVIAFGEGELRPLRAGEVIRWQRVF
jgi:dihydroorotase